MSGLHFKAVIQRLLSPYFITVAEESDPSSTGALSFHFPSIQDLQISNKSDVKPLLELYFSVLVYYK